MNELSDEILMAYADGQLDEDEAAKIRQAAVDDEEVRRRVDIFRQSAALLKGVYDTPLQEPVPQRLLDTVRNFKVEPSEPGMVTRLGSYFRTSLAWRPALAPAYTMVAMVALVMGIGLGYLIPQQPPPPPANRADLSLILKGGMFDRGLDTTASGKWFALEQAGVRILPVATFQDKENVFCRPYDVLPAGETKAPLAQGIACRNTSGEWNTKVYLATGPAASTTEASPSGFIPAGTYDHDLVLTIADHLMAAPPLTPGDELTLMDQGWRIAADQE